MLLKSDCYMEKIFLPVWNHRISRYPPEKIVVYLFALNRPFSIKIKKLRRITVRKQAGTYVASCWVVEAMEIGLSRNYGKTQSK